MTEQEFADLLDRPEDETLDFKAEQYDFSSKGAEKKIKRAKFVKDIICMSNTPRQRSSHIVLGVKCSPNGKKELLGITTHVDDADLQQKMSGWVHPHPSFTYEVIQYEGQTFGLISIPPARHLGPYYCINESLGDLLRPHLVYFRRGSQNATASQEEQKTIYAWFLDGKNLESSSMPKDDESPWDTFIRAVDHFTPRRSYILALSPLPTHIEATELSAFADIDWFFVADFDTSSCEYGPYSASHELLETRRALHLLTKGDFACFNPNNATYWYFIRGMEGRIETLSTGKWLDWHHTYNQDIINKVDGLARVIPRPTTIVAFWYARDIDRHLNTLLEIALPRIGSGAEVVIVSDEADSFTTMAQDYGAELVHIPLHQVLGGIKAEYDSRDIHKSNVVIIPTSSGAVIELESKAVAWLEEELEIVHRGLGNRPPSDAIGFSEFLRGKNVSWFDLALHADVERDLQSKLHKQVTNLLRKRRSARVNLYHEPGSGGTTISRRVVWDLCTTFPCVILNRCNPRQTIERLQHIFSLSGNPLVILAEGNCLSDQQSDQLEALLASRNIPAVILQILRRFEKPQRLSQNSYHLEALLSPGELYRFEAILCRDVPQNRSAINRATKSSIDSEKTPFYLGLVAFEDNFISLVTYVKRHLNNLNNYQRDAYLFLSLAYFYGQQTLDAHMFASLFGLPPNKPVDLTKLFGEYSLRLLVGNESAKWRPAHQLIAKEILQQVLSTGLDDPRQWNTRLSEASLKFIDFCAHSDGSAWEPVADLLYRIFLYRDERDVSATDRVDLRGFARIINDIPVDEGRLLIFKRLTDLFPDNAHFWAHLGRFYAIQQHEYDLAISAIDRALNLQEQDHIIHHIKGMALRSSAFDLMRDNAPLTDVIEQAKLASESFNHSREYAPDDEHGYISEVQLITRVLDYGAKAAHTNPILAASTNPDIWYREAFDAAENLLAQVSNMQQHQKQSDFVGKCMADLDALYGNHSKALETWQNLLDRDTAYAPPIRRQIVRTLLSRCDRCWDKMNEKDIERSLELLQKNVSEETKNGRNLRLWIRALRASNRQTPIEAIIEKVAYWATCSESLEAQYYLYVLHSLLAIDGSRIHIDRACNALDICRNMAKHHRNRTKSDEWLGTSDGIRSLVHHSSLGQWNHEHNFWENDSLLRRQEGIIVQIRGPESGTIEVSGLKAFFVPGKSNHVLGQSENKKVNFFLGFSYDGLRAWSVMDT